MFMDDSTRVKHILDASREAVGFLEGRDRADLDQDRMLNLSLVRLFEIIGEAAGGLSDSFKEKHSPIPWHQMVGMRNLLIYGYFEVNLDMVWKTVKEDLPPLIETLEKLDL